MFLLLEQNSSLATHSKVRRNSRPTGSGAFLVHELFRVTLFLGATPIRIGGVLGICGRLQP